MRSNVDVVKDLYQYFDNRDYTSIRSIFAPDTLWIQMDGFPNGGRYIGADSIFTHVFQTFSSKWNGWKAEVTDYLDAGDSVLALGYYQGTFDSTLKSVKAEFAHHYQLHNGKIVRFQQYTDTLLIHNAMKSD